MQLNNKYRNIFFNRYIGVLFSLLYLFFFIPSQANSKNNNHVFIKAKPIFFPEKIKVNSEFAVGFEITVNNPFHINSDKPLEDYLIPAALRIQYDTQLSIKIVKTFYSPGREIKSKAINDKLSVFPDTGYAIALLKIGLLEDKKIILSPVFSYQACDEQVCYAPEKITTEIILPVSDYSDTADILKNAPNWVKELKIHFSNFEEMKMIFSRRQKK